MDVLAKVMDARDSWRVLRRTYHAQWRWAGINGGQTVDKRWTNDGQPMDKCRES